METAVFTFEDANTHLRDMWTAFRSLTGLKIINLQTNMNLQPIGTRYHIANNKAFVLCELIGKAPADACHNIPGAQLQVANGSVNENLIGLQADHDTRPALRFIGQERLAA